MIVVVTVTLYNYIRHEAQMDWLFERYGDNELIIIGSDDEDANDELLGFMPSHLTSEMESFQKSLVSLVHNARQ